MKKIVFTTSCFMMAVLSFGQASVNTAGGTVSNASGSVSYSVGQVAYQNTSNGSGSVSQGVQQTYLVSVLNLEETKFNFSLNAYPNPTTEILNLNIANYNQENLTYKLIDLNSKLLINAGIQSQETKLNLFNLPVATYFLEVYKDDKKVQTFKIIKNQ
jgi:hypothetical protein